MIAGAAKATRTPASQPNKTSALAPKTNESETPPLSTPSTGTGKRLASVEAASSAVTPSKVVSVVRLECERNGRRKDRRETERADRRYDRQQALRHALSSARSGYHSQ